MTTQRLLVPDLIVTMDEDLTILSDTAVLVENGMITALGDPDDLASAHAGAERVDLPDRLLMPGLINAHHHSGMLRGTAEHLPVWEWLRLHLSLIHI